ncbi:DNA (cytosine-5-)-methyltransferase [Bacillus canaveralius]|uniref:DNA (cytosine-5-)-methyltransferase n=1 Tax=Bacillus canaveralius TaxID=1403243 RepID=A0A2N5GK28_9BACI|nr:DNA cytosine methyltransferase [Bacillus canaveralius]PLR81623.1 DNA (cytosine-5-)-methyltransferase [Bacillus canaveralius]PLR89914.1 DNA (cytosine-5-)-methyltransferase [Bacillus canaveralius]
MAFTAIDLFAGCGGLSEGLRQANFNVIASVEINKFAAQTYRLNHKETKLFDEDIRQLDVEEIKKLLDGETLHLLSGCPPCQGFSSIRRLNRNNPVEDSRNDLILEYLRFVKELKPLTIMMENVPAIVNYHLFHEVHRELIKMGYHIDFGIVDVANYGVPQRRKRFVMLGSRLANISIAQGNDLKRTVRDVIGGLESTENTYDPVHKIYPKHVKRIKEMIKKIPKDGGSRKDLPDEYILACHKKENVGFNDVYGRLRWDDVSSTITGGCLNPSKGRFLHPEEDRCISAREAALLQTFPANYEFPTDIPRSSIALMIGNALPPLFSQVQSNHINQHLLVNLI